MHTVNSERNWEYGRLERIRLDCACTQPPHYNQSKYYITIIHYRIEIQFQYVSFYFTFGPNSSITIK